MRSSEQRGRWLKILGVWAIELVVLFGVAEAVSVFFLPPAPRFYDPQMRMQPDPERIYDHVPNQRTFTIDQSFVTNSMGFRDEREVPLGKGGEFRILSLGDSVAVGLGVAAEATYARRLEASLSRRHGAVRVVNAAVACYATWQEVSLLREKGLDLRPDIVLLEFFWNDLYPKPANVAPLASRYTGEHSLLYYGRWLKRSRVLAYLREKLEIVRFGIAPSFDWAHQETIYEGRTNPYVEQAYADVAASLGEYASLGRRHGFVPILLIFPMPGQVRRLDALTHMQARMESIAQGIGLPFIDLLRPMQRASGVTPDLYIAWDHTHLSAHGHALVEAEIERYLDDHHLVTAHAGDGARARGAGAERRRRVGQSGDAAGWSPAMAGSVSDGALCAHAEPPIGGVTATRYASAVRVAAVHWANSEREEER